MRNSPESNRAASDLIGSEASVLISVTVHFKHSNLRCSKPSGPSETAVVVIRLWHLGQSGRWTGNSSGSGFLQLPITAEKIAPDQNICLSGTRLCLWKNSRRPLQG